MLGLSPQAETFDGLGDDAPAAPESGMQLHAGYAATGSKQTGSAYAEAHATQTTLYNEASASLSDDPTYSMAAQTALYNEASASLSDGPMYYTAAQTAPYDEARRAQIQDISIYSATSSPNMGIVTAQGMAF